MDAVDTLEDPTTEQDNTPAQQPWQLPDIDLPEPELSTPAWGGPLPEVDDQPDEKFPLGMVIGGGALGAVILGLGVFSAFGLAGVAVAAAATVVAGPAAAIGVSDYRRRLSTGQWRPQGSRDGARGRLRKAVDGIRPNRKQGGASRAGGLHRAGGRPSGAAAGRKAGTTPSGRAGTLRRAASSLTGSGAGKARKSTRTPAGTRKAAAGSSGARPSARLSKAIRGARTAAVRAGNALGFGRPTSQQRRAQRKSLRDSASMPGLRGWRARLGQRRAAKNDQVRARQEKRRQQRWDRADQRAQARRKWLTRRRKALRKGLRHGAARLRAFAAYPLQQAGRGLRRFGRRTRRSFSAAWRRLVNSRMGGYARRVRALNWQSLFLATMAKIGQMLRGLLVRMPSLLGAPKPAPAPAAKQKIRPDRHDDEQDTDAPAVARPGRRPRPAMSVPPPVVGHAPAVPTPRAQKGNNMSGAMHPAHEAAVDAFREAIGSWQPPDEGAYEEYESFFSSWQEMFCQMGDVVTDLSERFRDETPLETAPDYLDEVANGLHVMGDAGNEVYEAWRSGNAADIDRHENARPNEKQLNVA